MVRDRTADVRDLVEAVWRRKLGALVVARLDAFLHALGLLDDPVASRAMDPRRAWGAFVEPDAAWRTVGELLIVAHYEPRVRAAFELDVGAALRGWCGGEPVLATQRAFALARALGLVLYGRFGAASAEAFAPLADAFAAITQRPGPSNALPDERAEHLDHMFPFASGDAIEDAALRCIFEEVGRVGYDGAVLVRVAKRAGTDLNFIYRKFGSKLALFQAATSAQRLASLDVNAAYRAGLAERHGEAIAEALFMRELTRPGRQVQRATDLEQLRLSWHDQTLNAGVREETEAIVRRMRAAHPEAPVELVRVAIHAGRATGAGFVLLADLIPDLWRLPFQVVTTPMYAS